MVCEEKSVVLIGGATACGKSAVALELAAALDAEIINADSMQLYKDLPLLSASPLKDEMCGIRHHLYGVLDYHESSSAGDWLNRVDECLGRTQSSLLIMVGGTGLYLSSFLYGLSPIPEISDVIRYSVRQQAKAIMKSSGVLALYDCLVKKDPLIQGVIHPAHTQRLIRAWEVFEQTGISIQSWQKKPRVKNDYPKSQLFVLDADRTTLYQRIQERCLTMIKRGVLDELRAFMKKAADCYSPLHKAVGYSEFFQHLQGKITLEEAINQTVTASLQYAKRQQTWFRTQYQSSDVFQIHPDTPSQQASQIVKQLYKVNSEF
jgi:tRNA dimethylallyltransferase